jgi:hypothetical protein
MTGTVSDVAPNHTAQGRADWLARNQNNVSEWSDTSTLQICFTIVFSTGIFDRTKIPLYSKMTSTNWQTENKNGEWISIQINAAHSM